MFSASSLRFGEGRFVKLALMVMALCLAAAMTASAGSTLTTLVNFTGIASGGNPTAPVVQANDGNFYGTTLYGGPYGDNCNNPGVGCGIVYKMAPDGTLTILHSFCSQSGCPDGTFPEAGLVQGTDGYLYGTTTGNYNPLNQTGSGGTVFKIKLSDGTFSTIYIFCQGRGSCSDGNGPRGGVLQASDGNLYGTTYRGGTGSNCPYTYACGTVFKMTRQGTRTGLYSFCSQSDCGDGSIPSAGLIQGSDGNLYGTTASGGVNCHVSLTACGTTFKVTLPGNTFTSLHSFTGSNGDSGNLMSGLIEGVDGNFYGTTSGPPGTLFKMTPAGAVTTVHTFPDGVVSSAALVQGVDGNFYGTTRGNGSTIFKMTLGGMVTTLYSFCSLPHCSDGDQPHAAVTSGTDGNTYGTTYSGGLGAGTVFRLAGPAPAAVQYSPLAPCRLVDTRQTGGAITGGTSRTFVLPQLDPNGPCGTNIAPTATAYSLNVAIVPHGALNYLTVWPAGRPQPFVSTLNSSDGRTKSVGAIVSAGGNRAISVYASNTSDVIIDINGYFGTAFNTYQFYPLTPCRVADTRTGVMPPPPPGLGAPRLEAQETRMLPILTSPCLSGVSGPVAYTFNVTAVPNPDRHPLQFLTMWPEGDRPLVASLNNPTGNVVANAVIVPAAVSGDVEIYASDSTDVVLDITGYFAPQSVDGETFHAVVPCRAYDSRLSGGAFTGTREIPISTSACAPPDDAGAYVYSATVVPTSGPMGYLTLWPGPQDMRPFVATLNAYDGAVTSNLAIVPNTSGVTDAYAQGPSTTQLILDLSGYFAK